jgi:hypothetical protein
MEPIFQTVKIVNFGTALEVVDALTYYGSKFKSTGKDLSVTKSDFNSPSDNISPNGDKGFNAKPYSDPRTDTSSVSTITKPVLSLIGTPVFSNFNLQYGKKKLSHAINAVLFTVSQRRNVVTTALQGRDGEVIEFINEGNWKINAKIVISQINGGFPAILSAEVESMLAVKATLRIHSWYLNDIFKIRDVVVISKQFEQHQAKQNMHFIDIDFMSDTPENLD